MASFDVQSFQQFLGRLEIGEAWISNHVAFLPLLANVEGLDAELLMEALGSGHTEISEVNEGGVVNRVRVTHSGGMELLILDGEQVIGAKQNRIFASSFLISPGATVNVPVACVEQGRWGYRSGSFTPSGTHVTPNVRFSNLKSVTQSLKTKGSHDTDQGEVWREVRRYLHRTQTPSQTNAFSDGYATRSPVIEEQLDTMKPREGQVGVAIVERNRLAMMDVFGSVCLYAKAWRSVVRGALAEVFTSSTEVPTDPASIVKNALDLARTISLEAKPTPGGGETLSGATERFFLSALAHKERLYHVVMASV